MPTILIILAVLVMLAALLVIPIGLPGTWIMLGVLAVAGFYNEVGWVVLLITAVLAGVAELMEFLLVKRYSDKYGGTRRAFWGAILGGLAGVFIGLPIPIIGPVIAGVLGSFAGAALVTIWETRHLPSAARVGWGVVVARAFAVAVKGATGAVILAVGITALVL